MTAAEDAALDLEEVAPAEILLPTVQVLARLRSTAPDARSAVADVTERLAPVRGLYDEVVVERQEDDGSFWVVGRFVDVSVDASTAVAGVHETLRAAGIDVDEVWAPPT